MIMNTPIDLIKSKIIEKCHAYKDRLDRSRRLFIEDRSEALKDHREIEYHIKKEVSSFFNVNYSSISFTGSAQLGYSIHKNKLFTRRESDLDIACIDINLYQRVWIDIIQTTSAFTNETKFSGLKDSEIQWFKDSILRRGMVLVRYLPRSPLSLEYQSFEQSMSRKYNNHFSNISVAIYINEYAFCWKQDSCLALITRK
jgi:hypothetical protein